MKAKALSGGSGARMAPAVESEGAVVKLSRQMSVRIGLEYLRAMVNHLSEALYADGVLVGEFHSNATSRLDILAVSAGLPQVNPSFALQDSACSRIEATGKPVLCRSHARDRFPHDPFLTTLHAEACLAIPLQDLLGKPIGAMMAVYRAPVASFSTAKPILEVFARRASAELLHKREKDALSRNEQRYRAFVALNQDAMWCADFEPPIPTQLPVDDQIEWAHQHGYFSECNDAGAKLIGLERSQQVVGRRYVDLFPKIDRAMPNAIANLIHAGYQFTTTETTLIAPDGKQHFVLGSHLGIVEDGRLQRIWGVTRDITEFKQVQHALDASQQRMIDLLEAVQLLVLILDPTATIQFCNNHFFDLTKWSAGDLKGKNWFELVAPEERADLQARFAAELRDPGRPIHFESTLLGPDGRSWEVAWDATAVRDGDGKVKAIANIGRDITREKALRAHVLQTQKIESVGKLAGGVAHDFNNLLAVITGYTAYLLDQRSPADPDIVELTEIRNAAERGAQLTQQLLTFSRQRSSKPEVLNLNTIVERDSSMLRRTLGDHIELTTRLDPSLNLVRADPVQLSHVILNLSVNARDAMPHGGNLTIATSNATLDAGLGSAVPGVPDGAYVQLTVTDTGTGMSKEALDHLFEPFFTTKEPGKGTGLGLSIVYGIVKQSAGHITIESAPGRGTSVRIFLPPTQGGIANDQTSR